MKPLFRPPARRLNRGFSLVSAIFLLLVLSSLGAMIVSVSTTQSTASAQDVQGSRAYHAARAGVEWGLYQALDPLNATVVAPGSASWPNFPACPAAVMTIEGFAVTVGCSVSSYTEGATRSIAVYQLTATAVGAGAGVGSPTYVERQVVVTASKCRATDGAVPDYACP